MVKSIIPAFFCLICHVCAVAQPVADTSVTVGKKTITLTEIVLNNKLNVPAFIDRVKNDSTFYKAFLNLRLLNYSNINDIRMLDKSGNSQATLYSKTKQVRINNCRTMQTLEELAGGNFYTSNHDFNYYTARMYASLFFTTDSVCNENNIVAGREFSTSGKSGMEKHKEQLKMLFFNPGKKINGLPFISNKTEIYEDDMADLYDMSIDMDEYNKTSCYIFKQKVKPGKEGKVVIDEMTTWFDDKTFDVIARNYSLSYDASVYDFKVQMSVEMTHVGNLLVPSLIRYNGNWKAIFKKRERGVFTATIFDFTP